MRVTDLLVHSSFDFSTLYTTQGVAFFAKTHFTLDLTTKSVHRINRHLSGFLFAKGKMQDLRRQEQKRRQKSIGVGKIYDRLLLQQKQDFVVSARVPLQPLGHFLALECFYTKIEVKI